MKGVLIIYKGDNHTALESQRIISRAFLELMNEKKYSEINIKEICTKAGVSRQTFYSLFKTKENVIAYQMRCSCTHYPTEEAASDRPCDFNKLSVELMSVGYADFIYNNFEFLKLLVEHKLLNELQRYLIDQFTFCNKWKEETEIPRDTLILYFTGGMTGLISSLVMDDRNKDKNRLKYIIEQLFTGKYFI